MGVQEVMRDGKNRALEVVYGSDSSLSGRKEHCASTPIPPVFSIQPLQTLVVHTSH